MPNPVVDVPVTAKLPVPLLASEIVPEKLTPLPEVEVPEVVSPLAWSVTVLEPRKSMPVPLLEEPDKDTGRVVLTVAKAAN